ncbi:PTS ascorbate transporter subunit IIC [Actinobacteria bacterium YIM 96077]|uniref:Ascorbate-specific PTS system EIIC component n=1 Tax=Phytoactinopolyspora halophila TaxID=1981511 RepID=A0A329QQE5_9ACTN|nr:PTS ascorbate transporter subunit IIC [Phytoactinopolyspora halophila]AYY15683.1 PTS ascorbate transporter subunit IIC [Actinobacteria bacterium YIM 96077]RAW14131.1 PTS ascorbate transporter subunit IIC [Phytoactinopolyspora halophila]
MDVLEFIATNVFNEVAILIGLITMIGLLLQRKPVEDLIGGAIRATIGVLILFIGVDVFTGGLESFQAIVASAVGLDPPEASNTLDQFLGEHGSNVALVITFGFVIHLVLVRVFKTRYVYLTGHLLFWMAVVITACLVQAFGDIDQWRIVLVGSIIAGCYWTIQPLFIAPMMRRVISSDDWGYAHTSSSVAWLGGKVAPLVGDHQQHDVENVRMPRRLSFFKDVTVSTAVVIGVIMLIAIAFADQGVASEQAANYDPEVNTWVWAVIAAFRFAAGIAILLYGVRMFLAEIVPAFTGISEKAIKGSRPGLDVPTIFPVAPSAVMVGFVSTTATFLILMGVFAALGWFVLVPPMIMLFFVGAGAAVYGNAFGGWRGSVVAGAITGVALAFGQWAGWHMLADTAPELATLADPDWYIMMLVVLGLSELFSGFGANAVLLVALVVAVAFGVWLWTVKRIQRRAGEPVTGLEPESDVTDPSSPTKER